MLRRDDGFARKVAGLLLLGGCWVSAAAAAEPSPESGRQAHRLTAPKPKPNFLWLWYADGKAIPEDAAYCGDLRAPPAYRCNFGASLVDCQAQVQKYLDAWYKDFNLVFTLNRPSSGNYTTVVVSSGWPECATEAAQLTGGSSSNEGGIAPGVCSYSPLQTAVAIQCGQNAHDCATIIAHEHGHLAGLAHTTGGVDIMNAWVQAAANGFDANTLAVPQDRSSFSNPCGIGTQNSHKEMLTALGPWPGGDKPVLFPSIYDAGVPDGGFADADQDTIDAPTSGVAIGPTWGPTVDGGTVVLPGFDAISRTAPILPDAAPFAAPTKQSGCSFLPAPRSATVAIVATALFACSLAARILSRSLTRARRARARRA